MNEQRNFFIAIVLAFFVIFGFHYFYDIPRQNFMISEKNKKVNNMDSSLNSKKENSILDLKEKKDEIYNEDENIWPRINISTNQIQGSISAKGAYLDDIQLNNYFESSNSMEKIKLLYPEKNSGGYYCFFGWKSNDYDTNFLPNKSTIWTIEKDGKRKKELNTNSNLIFSFNNGNGLIFERIFFLDDQFMFTIKDKVTNVGKESVELSPFAQVTRKGQPNVSGYYILHEGPIAVLNNKLIEIDYKKISNYSLDNNYSLGGWIGITDKYWLVSIIPQQDVSIIPFFKKERPINGNITNQENYLVGYSGEKIEIKPGSTIEFSHNCFTGIKKIKLLDKYSSNLGIKKFDLAVDFGWFYFLTKPLFYLLEFLNVTFGNFGIAILILTIILKALLYPLSAKSFRAMNRMKNLQPKMDQIKTRFGDDKIRVQQELMQLYQKEKINPLSGCLPMLIQAPLFFCLYKVLFVTVEMRHTPFFGWINDLSAPDPTTIFNLFGVIPWNPPSFLMIGAWPIIMGITMYLQQKMSPQPSDPLQEKMVLYVMPVTLTFLLSQFPSGLLIYWAWSNVLGIIQQWYLSASKK